MWRFIGKRLLNMLAVAFVTVLTLFILRNFLPNKGLPCALDAVVDLEKEELDFCRETIKRYGLDKPIFYFSVCSQTIPKSYFKLPLGPEKKAAYNEYTSEANTSKMGFKAYLPAVYWHGSDNQFNRWLKRLINLDFGNSYRTKQSVWTLFKAAFSITFQLTIIALIFILITSFCFGLLSLYYPKWAQTKLVFGLLLISNIPAFVIALFAQLLFTSDRYGMDWFPASAFGGDTFQEYASRMVLPIFCLTFLDAAVLGIQFLKSIEDKSNRPFVLFAKVRGLSQKQIWWKEVLPNALVPLIPLVQNFFLSLFVGALLIEVVFNIPGMGKLFYDSLLSNDLNMLNLLVLGTGLASSFGFLVSDMILYFVDPRVRFEAS